MNVKEVLALYNQGTQYERAHGLAVEDWQLLVDCGDIKFYGRMSSDGRMALLMIFQAGKTGNWCGWMPNEEQANTLTNRFPPIYRKIIARNLHVSAVKQ